MVHWLDKTAARSFPVQVARIAAGTGLPLFLLTTQYIKNLNVDFLFLIFAEYKSRTRTYGKQQLDCDLDLRH